MCNSDSHVQRWWKVQLSPSVALRSSSLVLRSSSPAWKIYRRIPQASGVLYRSVSQTVTKNPMILHGRSHTLRLSVERQGLWHLLALSFFSPFPFFPFSLTPSLTKRSQRAMARFSLLSLMYVSTTLAWSGGKSNMIKYLTSSSLSALASVIGFWRPPGS